ncbi:2-polyprenyl-6-methoxyphenol hydroxylase-like oxidoreductase [bacterium]|nr:2-polyprenyl-6-methoxyphenol hydroxylase-like oxidoreductase [bacterium]
MSPIPHAVVIGGSIAGLLAARVLMNHCAQVTVIERDLLPSSPEFRKGAPQGRHAHGLLARGHQILEAYFPGLTEDLRAHGAVLANMGADLALYLGGVPVSRFETDLVAVGCSRPLLEYVIQQRLRQSGRVRFLEGYDVTGICTDAAGKRATGVRMQRRGAVGHAKENAKENATGNASEIMDADLIVDASGRGSRLPEWLRTLGFTPPTETVVDANAGYATRIYRRPQDFAGGWQALYNIAEAPAQSRGCIVLPMEGDRWYVTLTGLNGDHPPTDEDGFLAFARSIPVPAFHAALAQAEPLTAPYGYRNAANRLRSYDKLPRYLEGVLAMGDSVYALNPLYGQGMTVAALGAETLDATLSVHLRRHAAAEMTGLARRFQRNLAKVIAAPWQLATGQDMRWPSAAAGQKTDPVTRLIQGYFDRVLATMVHSPEVAAAFARVQNMLASPATLFHPHIVWQILQAQPKPITPAFAVTSFNGNPKTEEARN